MSAFRTVWQRTVIAAAVVVSSLHAVYFIQSAWLDREAEQSRTLGLERWLVDVQRKLASHDSLVEQLNDMRGRLPQAEQRLPVHVDPAGIETTLRDQASNSKIEITDLQVGAEFVREGYYAEVPVILIVRGKTADFLAFMDTVLRASPLRRITQMNIEPDGSGVQARLALMYDHSLIEDVL